MKRIASLAVIALLFASPALVREASTQTQAGNLRGTLLDQEGWPVPSTITGTGPSSRAPGAVVAKGASSS